MKLFPKYVYAGQGRVRQAAFTMIEIALCLAVIGFALVAIIGVLPIGMSTQKDNREETIIGFDANYLAEAIRSGTRGYDVLTNHVVAITNYWTRYDANTNFDSQGINWFTTKQFSLGGPVYSDNYLTNGQNIIGLLSTPRYVLPLNGGSPGFITSNYVTADFRAINSSAADQGTNTDAREFAFTYRLESYLSPFLQFDSNWTNYLAPGLLPSEVLFRSNYFITIQNTSPNFNELRLSFKWPVLPNGTAGNGRQTFRTMASGYLNPVPPTSTAPTLYFIQPQNYTMFSHQ